MRGLRVVAVPRSRHRVGRMTVTVARLLRAALTERAAVYHLHDPELIPLGFVLKALGRRVIYDAHEHLPHQILAKDWIPKPARRGLAAAASVIEMAADRLFDGIVVANPSTVARFNPRHTVLVENFVRETDRRDPLVPLAQRPIAVAYVGGLGHHRGLWQMLEAIRLLDRPGIRVVLAGPLEQELSVEQRKAIPGNVDLPGRVSREQADRLLREAAIGLSVLQPVPNFREGHYPTKLFEYMSAGMAVIASDFPLYRRVVDEAECGLVVDPTDPAAIATAIAILLDSPDTTEAMGARGRHAVATRYSWPAAEERLLHLYSRVVD